ncbi:hypothetical protein Drorol1_Dr00017135 [Drosera rotundifolia]
MSDDGGDNGGGNRREEEKIRGERHEDAALSGSTVEAIFNGSLQTPTDMKIKPSNPSPRKTKRKRWAVVRLDRGTGPNHMVCGLVRIGDDVAVRARAGPIIWARAEPMISGNTDWLVKGSEPDRDQNRLEIGTSLDH